MLSFLPAPVKGVIGALLVVLNTVFWTPLLYPLALVKVIFPFKWLREFCNGLMVAIAENWVTCNNINFSLMHKLKWDVRLPEGLNRTHSYLVCANHQSWIDIVFLQKLFTKQIPFLRFFVKNQLIYIPLLGQAFWALDFPVMKRYTREYLEKHPEKRGKDLETTRAMCERIAGTPTSVINFLEGTRFTASKHLKQGATYRHLLAPKTGGIAFVLECMGRQFDALLDVTIYYPQRSISLWDLLCGKIDEVVIRVEKIAIPPEFLCGNYLDDEAFRERIQAWVRELWIRKDLLLSNLAAAHSKGV